MVNTGSSYVPSSNASGPLHFLGGEEVLQVKQLKSSRGKHTQKMTCWWEERPCGLKRVHGDLYLWPTLSHSAYLKPQSPLPLSLEESVYFQWKACVAPTFQIMVTQAQMNFLERNTHFPSNQPPLFLDTPTRQVSNDSTWARELQMAKHAHYFQEQWVLLP